MSKDKIAAIKEMIRPVQDFTNLICRTKAILPMFLLILQVSFGLTGKALSQESGDTLKFFDGQGFTIIGKFHAEKNYARFPQKYKNTLRPDVWNLGRHSAGMSIRFRTNSPVIVARWTLLSDSKMDHMAFTGIKGIDLYAWVDGHWRYVSTGRVKGKTNEFTMVKSGGNMYREYLLNLPLYDGVDSLSIGIDRNAEIIPPQENFLVSRKPVVYYGTSIAQGGCASRPGLAFTNILARALDRSFINMGFSGNGTYELSVGEALCETDAALYVLDCNPNTKPELIYERVVELVRMLKRGKPDVPVLLVEGFYYENGFENPRESVTEKKRVELRRAFKTLKESGVKQLFYLKGDNLIGHDHEGTVDGVHPNDLGMMRMAESLKPVIRRILR